MIGSGGDRGEGVVVYVWLSLIYPKLEAGTKCREAVSY